MTQWLNRLRRRPASSSASAEELLTVAEFRKLLAGDKYVLGRFIPAVLPTVRGAVRAKLSRRGPVDPSREDDLTHDLMERLLSDLKGAIGGWDPENKKSLQSFVWQWASWRAVDLLRGPRYSHSREALMENAKLYAAAGSTEIDESLRSIVQQLLPEILRLFNERAEPEQKELFHQIYVLERKPVDVAAELGITTMNLYQRLARLRKLLRDIRDELLSKEGHDD